MENTGNVPEAIISENDSLPIGIVNICPQFDSDIHMIDLDNINSNTVQIPIETLFTEGSLDIDRSIILNQCCEIDVHKILIERDKNNLIFIHCFDGCLVFFYLYYSGIFILSFFPILLGFYGIMIEDKKIIFNHYILTHFQLIIRIVFMFFNILDSYCVFISFIGITFNTYEILMVKKKCKLCISF